MKTTLILVVVFCCLVTETTTAQFLKEYVRSFALRSDDTILIDLPIPYEIIDWDKKIVRTFSQVESFSLPDELLKRLSRKGRYSIRGTKKNNLLHIHMPEIHHDISVQGVRLTDEVIAQIYVPKGVPLKVVCSTTTPEEQLKDLWLQQEVLTRRLKYPIRKAINADYYADVAFKSGVVVDVQAVKGTKRFVQLTIESNGTTMQTVSRIGKLYENIQDLRNQEIVFVAHTFAEELRKLPNEGMVIVQEDQSGKLTLITKANIPDFLIVN